MSFETGGRAEKYGDEYENRYLAKLLLRVVNESLSSIIVEPIGENSDSVEFITEDTNGIYGYYQCKASNNTKPKWSIADLQKYSVFDRIKRILFDNANARYFFISPLSYNELDELCKRARTTPSAKALIEYQLTNPTISNTFKDCAKAFQLNVNNDHDMEMFKELLSRCYFERCLYGIEAVRDLEEQIGLMFTGNASEVRVLLEQYANSVGRYGVRISAKDIVDYLESLSIYSRCMHYDNRILPRIQTLNNTYWDTYPAINGQLIHREATSNIIHSIEEGHSVILHGKAGSGKSGCLQETINQLKQNQILYLAIKLDKTAPERSADEFGIKLGLPESPILCLTKLAGESPCVLILDQLDALRWTTNHSAAALSVCKELISQAEACNKHEGNKISIVFASRTFDLENDRGLNNLFITENRPSSLEWERITIGDFTQLEVVQLIGDSYNHLSSRIQKLLLTPSSLYVWTQLEESRKLNNISSVYQLMKTWWEQILDRSELNGITQERIIQCKNTIVDLMEQNTVFSLPETLFVDERQSLSSLISNGIIRSDGTRISFVHQSFLDYFITSDYLMRIYDGAIIVDLIEPYDKQIPQVRYRLTSVLQNLIESDQNMFVQQARSILESNQVHYYFQCAVFEVIGQCENPNRAVFSLIDHYSSQQAWSKYIFKAVYYAHPVFVKHLEGTACNWLDDTYLSILHTINNLDPDFVANTLRSCEINSIEDARRVFWALCFSSADDSENMFQFRVELLKRFPVLLDHYYGISDLYARNPSRATHLLTIMIENSSAYKYQSIYFGEKNEIDKYVSSNYESIIKDVFPLICQQTSSLIIKWPFYYSSIAENDRAWLADDFKKTALREIVDITKGAISEYTKRYPSKLCKLIKEHQQNSSAVCHELLSHAISCLPEEHGDFAIQWLLQDFDANVFVFTANQEDYLLYAKQIIRKFSPTCSSSLFQQLEHTICIWKDSSNTMCNIYKHRIEINKSNPYQPVYYAFWGHMQKELLPCLDINKMSSYSRELIQVLNRNTWIKLPHFYSGIITSPAKTVVSPIHSYAERISDARWLKIISTPIEKMGKSWRGIDEGLYYIEADHRAFSDSFRIQAAREPARFAQLSLSFPVRCYVGYVIGVFYALEKAARSDNPVDIDLISQVIRHFADSLDQNVAIAIARIVEHRAKETWPNDVLDLIAKIATTHPDPKADEYPITSSDDPEHLSVRSLQENEINCARGCALHTIAALIWENAGLMGRFKPIVSIACRDNNPAVRFAALYCLLPYLNTDSPFVVAKFRELLNADLRIIGAHGFWDILSQDYSNNQQDYREILLEACKSSINDLSKKAAGCLCALAIFKNDNLAYEAITTQAFSDEQQNTICNQAVSSFNNDVYHERSKDILLYYIGKTNGQISSYTKLFYRESISIQRDSDFLICLMKSTLSNELLHSFVNYLNKSDEDICQFAEVLKTLSESLLTSPLNLHEGMYVDNLVQCIIRLSDRGKNDPAIQTISLEIWDNLFRCNLQDIKPLSGIIDNFE